MSADRPGFFIPYRHAASVRPTAYPALVPWFAQAEGRMLSLLVAAERYGDALEALDGPPPQPRFDQDWFARTDAAVAYTLVRDRRPRRIVEIGSGHSTRFLARAIRDGGLATSIRCIDPQPRASLAGLDVTHDARLLTEVGDIAASLGAGDILFIDSSHVAMPGSDVDLLLSGVLPRLARGTLVHVHDVFLPDAYPEAWAWRGYNEQLLVAALIQGGAWRIEFSSHWATTRLAERLGAGVLGRLPLRDGVPETSLWLSRTV